MMPSLHIASRLNVQDGSESMISIDWSPDTHTVYKELMISRYINQSHTSHISKDFHKRLTYTFNDWLIYYYY